MADYDEMRQNLNLLADEELTAILQEHNEDEWRPEVFDIVRSILKERGISPDLKRTEATEEEPAELELVSLVAVGEYNSCDSADAVADQTALEGQGLKTWINRGMNGWIQLKVKPEDFKAALNILGEPGPALSSDLPEDIAEPPCPKCGSRDVMEKAEIMEPSLGDTRSSALQQWLYHCGSCGYKWGEP
jgi:hypothetical protein